MFSLTQLVFYQLVTDVSLLEYRKGDPYYLNVTYGTGGIPWIYINTGVSETPPSPWSTAANIAYGCRAQAGAGTRNASHNMVYWFIMAELAQITGFEITGHTAVTSYGQSWELYNIGIRISVQCLNYLSGDSITKIGWALMSV